MGQVPSNLLVPGTLLYLSTRTSELTQSFFVAEEVEVVSRGKVKWGGTKKGKPIEWDCRTVNVQNPAAADELLQKYRYNESHHQAHVPHT